MSKQYRDMDRWCELPGEKCPSTQPPILRGEDGMFANAIRELRVEAAWLRDWAELHATAHRCDAERERDQWREAALEYQEADHLRSKYPCSDPVLRRYQAARDAIDALEKGEPEDGEPEAGNPKAPNLVVVSELQREIATLQVATYRLRQERDENLARAERAEAESGRLHQALTRIDNAKDSPHRLYDAIEEAADLLAAKT